MRYLGLPSKNSRTFTFTYEDKIVKNIHGYADKNFTTVGYKLEDRLVLILVPSTTSSHL
jgi:hypothetical protein